MARAVQGCVCELCSVEFVGSGNNPNRFCSRDCWHAWRRAQPAPKNKKCAKCQETLPVEDFGSHKRMDRVEGKIYYSTYCLPCRREVTDPSTTRRYSLKKRYGITPEEFDDMLARQGGCASCGSTTTNGKYWHIDHDHSCCPTSTKTCGRCIRGILCHGCNTALGNLGDDPEKVEALLNYIRRTGGE